jgi:hypothetical protein
MHATIQDAGWLLEWSKHVWSQITVLKFEKFTVYVNSFSFFRENKMRVWINANLPLFSIILAL